jgi:[ribosomal protein S18]-alanine N-acetyltransferase
MIFSKMEVDDVAQVVAIETSVFPYPWSRGNFLDSLASGYEGWVMRDANQHLLAYFVVMVALDEAHLLTIAVRQDAQGTGVGRLLMDKAVSIARGGAAEKILLEVRPSNSRALGVYQRYGFKQIGLRKAYYPAPDNGREDALVMAFQL